MGGASLGASAGVVLGLAVGLWLVLRKNGQRAGIAALALTGAAAIVCSGFVLIAFD